MTEIEAALLAVSKPTLKQQCYLTAFQKLDPKDQENINRLVMRMAFGLDGAYKFKKMGVVTAFELVATLAMYNTNTDEFYRIRNAYRRQNGRLTKSNSNG